MGIRHQLPVSSPVRLRGLIRALPAAITRRADDVDAVTRELTARLGSRRLLLTDSGTSALVLALRAAVGPGGTVAFPGYACVDLASAARYAGVRVRLYDVDPATLGPDWDSLRRTLARGVDAVLAVHLYGFAVDVPAMAALAASAGVALIEDAAQAAGGVLRGSPLGSLAPLAVLSFGRGKGVTGGGGGALVANDAEWSTRLARIDTALAHPTRGTRELVAATAQWLVGRPSLYGLPASIPSLQLGEMVYHPAHEPRRMSGAVASLLRTALVHAPDETAARRRNAAYFDDRAARRDLAPVVPLAGSAPGYLRYPVRDRGARQEQRLLGIMRGYPRTLHEQQELQPCLIPNEPPTPGAEELRRTLFTLPTHSLLRAEDREGIARWLAAPGEVAA